MNTNTLDALRTLYMYGPMYKSDFVQLLGTRGAQNYNRLANRIRNERNSDGFIEREIRPQGPLRQADQTATIVSLSDIGTAFYKDHEQTRIAKLPPAETVSATTKQVEKLLWPHLAESKAFALYQRAGVNCFSFEKPSLGYLVFNLSFNAANLKKQPFSKNYLDVVFEKMDAKKKEAKLREFMNSGAYYTKKEVNSFFRLYGKNYADSFKGLKWHGLFVSSTNMLITFILDQGENKRLYLKAEYLNSILQKLQDTLATATNVFRTIRTVSDSRNGYQNRIDALTVGIGSSHTYSEAMGNKYGLIKGGRDMTVLSTRKGKNGEEEEAVKSRDIIDCTSRTFSRIYSIDDRSLGVTMLEYITSHSLEEYHDHQVLLFQKDPRFDMNAASNVFPAIFSPLKIRSIFLPVYEIKILKKIADEAKRDNYPVVIVTRKEMMETISHCVHIESVKTSDKKHPEQPGLFFVEYDGADDLQTFINEDSGVFCIYDHTGHIMGKKMIDDLFVSKGMKLKSEAEYTKLARLCMKPEKGKNENLSEVSDSEIKCIFFNTVARSSLDEVLGPYFDSIGTSSGKMVKLVEKTRWKKERRKNYLEECRFRITTAEHRRLKRLASSSDLSVAQFMRQKMFSVLDAAEARAKKDGISEGKALDLILKEMHQKRHN